MTLKMAVDEFRAAVVELAASEGDLKARLTAACMNHIGFLGPTRAALATEIKTDFDSINQEMTKKGDIRVTVNAMSQDEAEKLAVDIVGLAFRLTEEYSRQSHS